MPANEQTWRKPSLMHTVFAVSSVLMLIATVWMMADDHNRPWKEYLLQIHYAGYLDDQCPDDRDRVRHLPPEAPRAAS